MMMDKFNPSPDRFNVVSDVREAQIENFYFPKDCCSYKILVGMEVNKVCYLYFKAFFLNIIVQMRL
jgi:hypothetical protein